LRKLLLFVENELGREDDDAWSGFYDHWADATDSLDGSWMELSEAVYDMWFCFDCRLESGETPAEVFLGSRPHLSRGERVYLEQMRESTMELYEVEGLRPGESLDVRQIATGSRMTVRERSGSRSLHRHDLLAARVISVGPSGGPEFERGLLLVPELVRGQLLDHVEEHRRRFRSKAGLSEELTVLIHDAWIRCLVDPPIPDLKNTDGDDVLLTRVRFEVTDPDGLESALDAGEDLGRDDEGGSVWHWSGVNRSGEQIALGRVVWEGPTLELECNSAPRGARGRALIEAIAGVRVRHASTSHENPKQALRESILAKVVGGPDAAPEEPPEIPWELQEALVLDHMGRHYRDWIDDSIPALGGRTPRDAVGDPRLRPKVAELVRGLEGAYQMALGQGHPAYDPSWMWDELGFATHTDRSRPPPLAYERALQIRPDLGDLCRALAAEVRARPGFDDASTVVTAAELERRVEVRSLLRRNLPEGPEPGTPGRGSPSVETQLPYLVSFELHRRKTFWVAEALAFLLAKTDVDVPGADLRVPFPCFALVFTDRHVLGMAERLLSRDRQCPFAGHFLRVATVFVMEESFSGHRVLHLGFAFDAGGADPPYLVSQDVPLVDETSVRPFVEGLGPEVVTDPPVPDANPLRGLVHTTLNAILYATSAGVEPQRLPAAPRPRRAFDGAEPVVFGGEEVFHLPGAIEISQLRKLQELERIPTGRSVLHRFMVRGHWRRAARSWKDQRLRWIEPYWKGPDLAAVVERTYKLEPPGSEGST
jgi:hypothetical protein